MPTPFEIERQVQFERDSIRQGLKRLEDQTKRLEGQSYASATVYGIASIDTLLPLLVERIEQTTNRIHERQNGVLFKEVNTYLKDVEPLAAAAITCKITFDKVFSFKKDDSPLVVNVTEAIGKALEDECQMRYYEEAAPGLLKHIQNNYWHSSSGTRQKLITVRTLFNRKGIPEWKRWGRGINIKLGGWLLCCLMESSNWFFEEMVQEGKKRHTYVRPTPEFLEIKDQVMHNA